MWDCFDYWSQILIRVGQKAVCASAAEVDIKELHSPACGS